MIRHVFIFLATFAVGAVIALVGRASMYRPHADHSGGAPIAAENSPMVTNTPTAAADPHAGHARPATPPAPSAAAVNHESTGASPSSPAATKMNGNAAPATANSICAICGMAVDPKIPAIEFQGKMIGFGCRMCPPKFKADPEKYGPLYLRNEPIKR